MSAQFSQEVQAQRRPFLEQSWEPEPQGSVLSAHQPRPLPPPPTLSRCTVHVTILFQQLNEPSKASPAHPGQYFRSPLERMAGCERQV